MRRDTRQVRHGNVTRLVGNCSWGCSSISSSCSLAAPEPWGRTAPCPTGECFSPATRKRLGLVQPLWPGELSGRAQEADPRRGAEGNSCVLATPHRGSSRGGRGRNQGDERQLGRPHVPISQLKGRRGARSTGLRGEGGVVAGRGAGLPCPHPPWHLEKRSPLQNGSSSSRGLPGPAG